MTASEVKLTKVREEVKLDKLEADKCNSVKNGSLFVPLPILILLLKGLLLSFLNISVTQD
jgi:hypothetical protein